MDDTTQESFEDVFEEITDPGQEEMTPEEVKKRAHGADSMRGRLAKEKEKARKLEEELEKKAEYGAQQEEGQDVPEKDETPAQQATGDHQGDDEPGPEKESAPDGQKAEEQGPDTQTREPGKGSDDQAIPEDVRKKAAEYELIIERLRAQQERNRQLEAQLNSDGEQAGARQPASGQDSRSMGPAKKVAIPEELQEDAREFQDQYPDFYAYLEEDSPAGKRMRDALRDYGPEQAALVAETRMLRDEIERTRREAEEKTSAITRKIQEEEVKRHFDVVAEKHPEMGWRSSDRHKEWVDFINNVRGWIETLPYREAQQAMQVAEKGTADQVIQLLDAYKAATGSGQQGHADQPTQPDKQTGDSPDTKTAQAEPPVSNSGNQQAREDKEKMIRAAEAIASRPAPPRPPRPDPDDFDAAWDEAVGKKR